MPAHPWDAFLLLPALNISSTHPADFRHLPGFTILIKSKNEESFALNRDHKINPGVVLQISMCAWTAGEHPLRGRRWITAHGGEGSVLTCCTGLSILQSLLPWPVEAEADFFSQGTAGDGGGQTWQSHDPICSDH